MQRNLTAKQKAIKNAIKNHGVFNSQEFGVSLTINMFDISKSVINLFTDIEGIEIIDSSFVLKDTYLIDLLASLYTRSLDSVDTFYATLVNNNITIASTPTANVIPRVKIIQLTPDSVVPTKARGTDVGYDLTIIRKDKDIGTNTFMYGTGITLVAPIGYYTKLVPRSSLVKTGYILSNSVGIIDNGYRGELKVVLTKVDHSFPDLELPFCGVQIILEKQVHYDLVVDTPDSIAQTSRGTGGFGSTNKPVRRNLMKEFEEAVAVDDVPLMHKLV